MNRQEASILLATVQAYDRRTVGETDVLAWQAALFDVALPDATRAVTEHVRISAEWLTPAHVLAGVKRLRTARLPRECPDPIPPCDPDDVDAYRRQLAEARQGRASGQTAQPAAALPASSERPLIPAGPRGGRPRPVGDVLAGAARARAALQAALGRTRPTGGADGE